jgi:type I restriction enzyme R subunit
VAEPEQLRERLRRMPDLVAGKLWRVQVEAVRNLERSLAQNRPRALIQMATGSGKTYTAASICYRLIKFPGARRVLFLVDRNNLGRQTLSEFQQYTSSYGKQYKFTEEYPVQRLTKNTIDPASKVCITTIQRLYSILKGEEEFDESGEETSLFETESPLARKEPMPVVYNPSVPIETFDFIIVDECHRSIYNVWRQVLEYFDAFLIGLTATPTNQTVGFFLNNVVQDYSHERAVADGVNVGYDVYQIRTQIGTSGATMVKEPGVFVPHRDKRTRQRRLAELDSDLTYTANQLDRDVVAEDQIRLVVRTFRDRLFTEIFPGRSEVPKTLVFAKTDNHAEDIVRIMREEFGQGNDFCQKITSKTTGRKPDVLLNEFRNSYNPRIAVTVDLIATGTDVKVLECLLFMRNIASASYFEQMKGRGVRVISADDLRQVTSDARGKTRFVIVDAVGVCERDKTHSKPLDRTPSVPLDRLLDMTAKGMVHADLVSTLASRLARLGRQLEAADHAEIAAKTGGKRLEELTGDLLASIDPDEVEREARDRFELKDAEPSEKQMAEVERDRMGRALKPFQANPKLRQTILTAQQSLEQLIDELSRDELLKAGFDGAATEKARKLVADFKVYLDASKEEIEALSFFYSVPYRAGLRFEHLTDLHDKLRRSPLGLPEPQLQLWRALEVVEPKKVRGKGGTALADLVNIVRHVLSPTGVLVPRQATVDERFLEWQAEQEAAGVVFTEEQMRWLEAIKDHIAQSLAIEDEDFEYAPFNQLGGKGKAYQVFGDRLATILGELNERLAA